MDCYSDNLIDCGIILIENFGELYCILEIDK